MNDILSSGVSTAILVLTALLLLALMPLEVVPPPSELCWATSAAPRARP